jgi:hypothetical protein
MAEPMGHYTHAESEYRKRDAEGRRCEGNNRRCTQRAIEQHLVRRSDQADADNEIKQTCGRHRQQFINSVMWIHISTSRMGGQQWRQAS